VINGDVIVAVIDDDPSVRRGLSRLFRSRGYQAETYASARGFLERGDYARFACLVLDVRMPGQTGLDLQDILTVGGHDLPIVFITGHGDVPLEVRAMKAGAVDVLAKPFDDEALFRAVERAVQKKPTVRTAGERR
jgi:two-component system, LuxR family, response regulator FixJ